MKTIFQKTIWLFCIAFAVTSCSKDENKDAEANGECWYKVTIDGQTTLPNQFGQDNLVLSSTTGPDGRSGFVLSIGQTKANGRKDSVFDFSSDDGVHLNHETPVGTTYTANFFYALQLSVGEFDGFEYDKGRFNNKGEITLTVMENSNQRTRFKVSGTVMKWEGGVENPKEVELTSVEAEFSFDRSYYNEVTSGGVFATGVGCDCKQILSLRGVNEKASEITYQAFFFDNSLDNEPFKLIAHLKGWGMLRSGMILARKISPSGLKSTIVRALFVFLSTNQNMLPKSRPVASNPQ